MNDRMALFGTSALPLPGRRFSVGDLSFTVENGGLRHVKLSGIEIMRGIAFLVRDRDWGTLEPAISDQTLEQGDGFLRLGYHAQFTSHGAMLNVGICLSADANGLSMAATGWATGRFETNRAGFTVLHPIDDVAGRPVRVEHGDGSTEEARFPELIAPWQPFMDIAALTHNAGGNAITCRFRGDIFEMEDQRQWGDASFKTYVRPLALPWPYEIGDGETLEQAVELTWKVNPAPAVPQPPASLQPPSATSAVPSRKVSFPEMALVITPEDAQCLARHPNDLAVVRPQRLLCHLDATQGAVAAQFRAFSQAQRACPDIVYDLELVCICDADPAPELMDLARIMRDSDFRPSSVLVCPSVDRQSTPPGSDWPACPPLEQIHGAVADAFPGLAKGGGMVSFFPELNRKRPPVEMLDFVSHGLCPIVHAADDVSVMETLQAIPHITRSARAIIGDRPYRIGPATIAMRQNPYGSRTISNPALDRVCMTDDDPRHRALFGAAYVVGLATALAPAGIAVWTPAALYGPRGLLDDGDPWPLAEPLRVLAGLAGQTVHAAAIDGGVARLHLGSSRLAANLTPDPVDNLSGYGWRVTP